MTIINKNLDKGYLSNFKMIKKISIFNNIKKIFNHNKKVK